MGLYRTGGGGGALSETTLWTNSAPTSNFNEGDYVLSQSVENFKEIAIYYRLSTTSSSETYVKYDVDELKTYLLNSTNGTGGMGYRISSNTYIRTIYYTDTTHIYFGKCFKLNSTSTAANVCIPTKIVGLK